MQLLRSVSNFFQRVQIGWDNSDAGPLDVSIAKFALPRLRRYKLARTGHPTKVTSDEWTQILNELEWFLEVHARIKDPDPEEVLRYEKAKYLWGEHFQNLWW